MRSLRGILQVEAVCLSPVACHCGGMVGGAVLSSVHWSDAPVTPDPVRRGSSCSLNRVWRVFSCWRRAGHCMFDRRGEPRLGRWDGAGALIPRLQELGPVHNVGAPVA